MSYVYGGFLYILGLTKYVICAKFTMVIFNNSGKMYLYCTTPLVADPGGGGGALHSGAAPPPPHF